MITASEASVRVMKPQVGGVDEPSGIYQKRAGSHRVETRLFRCGDILDGAHFALRIASVLMED